MLTDGLDNKSDATASRVIDELRARSGSEESLTVRVFTIAYGSEPDADVLAKIAAASEGKDFSGDPKQIEAVYLSISSFF